MCNSMLLEVPLGSNEHTEGTERNLLDAERESLQNPAHTVHTWL